MKDAMMQLFIMLACQNAPECSDISLPEYRILSNGR